MCSSLLPKWRLVPTPLSVWTCMLFTMTLECGGATVSMQWPKLRRTVPQVWGEVCLVFYLMKLFSDPTFCRKRSEWRNVRRRLQGTHHADSERRGFWGHAILTRWCLRLSCLTLQFRREFLDRKFLSKLSDRRGVTTWPPRSPDLISFYLFFCGRMKKVIFVPPSPTSLL